MDPLSGLFQIRGIRRVDGDALRARCRALVVTASCVAAAQTDVVALTVPFAPKGLPHKIATTSPVSNDVVRIHLAHSTLRLAISPLFSSPNHCCCIIAPASHH